MEVEVRDSFERALKIFIRKCTPIVRELRDRRGYLKPSAKAKRKHVRYLSRLKEQARKRERRDV